MATGAKLRTQALRISLSGIQYVAATLANLRHQPESIFKHTKIGDLFKAWRIAELHPKAESRLLDVGCGSGALIEQIQLFREIDCVGVDLAVPRGKPHLQVYDGRTLPFDDQSFSTVIFGYVLHHLSRAHAEALVSEALRVLRKGGGSKLILLEDSLATIGVSYRLRNWAHFVEAGLDYSGRSSNYRAPRRPEMFLNHAEWRDFISDFPGVSRVDITSLSSQFTYQHHTLICAHVD